MAGDLTKTKKFTHAVKVDEAIEAVRKAASRSGKAKLDKRGRVVLRPSGSIHRLTIKTEVEAGREQSSAVTISGRLGIAPIWLLLWIVFVLFMAITVVGLILVFVTSRSSIKCQSASKKDPLSACKRDPLRQAA